MEGKIWHVRADVSPDSDWYLHVEDLTPLVVVHELSSKHHDHALFFTQLKSKEAINKRVREATSIEKKMGIQSVKWDNSDVLLSYMHKQKHTKHVDPSFEERWSSAPPWVDRKPAQHAQKDESDDSPKQQWTMWSALQEEIKLFRHFEPPDWKTLHPTDEYQQWDPRWDDVQYFTREFLRYFERKKRSWDPRFKISNMNTFYSYIVTIHARESPETSTNNLYSARPDWFTRIM